MMGSPEPFKGLSSFLKWMVYPRDWVISIRLLTPEAPADQQMDGAVTALFSSAGNRGDMNRTALRYLVLPPSQR